MPVKIACPNPNCDASYSILDENLGKVGRCKKCGTKFPLVPGTRDGASPQTDLDSASKPPDPQLPETIGRYKVMRLLGRGGMGSVYLAQDLQLERQVALRQPAAQVRRQQQLLVEAVWAKGLGHVQHVTRSAPLGPGLFSDRLLGRGKGVGRLVERSPSVPRRDRGHLDQLIRF